MAISAEREHGFWYRIAHSVMRRPVVYAVVVGLLVALALPFLRVQFGGIDVRVLPADQESRIVALPDAVDSPARQRRAGVLRRGGGRGPRGGRRDGDRGGR
jgi:RND superfamily putative drug exporter